MTDFDSDDETRRLLGALDPARSLPPVDADALATILEDTMSQTSNEPGGRRRFPRLALLGGVAAAVAAVAIAIPVLSNSDDKDSAPSATTPAVTTPPAQQTVTALTAGPAFAAKCMAPSADRVATQTVAFEGTVTNVSNGVVTLDPSHFYAGAETEVVTVAEPDQQMTELPVDFQVGKDYIVGATDGQVSICGLSGLATDELRALYERAFAR